MADRGTSRREMLRLVGVGGLALASTSWLSACGGRSSSSGSSTVAPTTSTPPPFNGYGPLGAVDANGLRLPVGFTSRVIATSEEVVTGTTYTWPRLPDGGATYSTDGGGWIYVVNSEVPDNGGGVSMVRFDADGTIVEARSILSGTSRNCAGGATPWGTWLSCEEVPAGHVHQCDPTGAEAAVALPAMGAFNHEAAAVDPGGKAIYLSEDELDGAFYRFVPTSYPDLTSGSLEVLTENGSALEWVAVPDPSAASTPTRKQVPGTKVFVGGEGLCYHDGVVYLTTKGDNRVWSYEPATNSLTVVYDAATVTDPVLRGVDNITVSPTGELYVAEDGDNMQIVLIDGSRVEAVVEVTGVENSEMVGPAFSPDGTRLYFSSQRNPGRTYEVTGPWYFET
jgi:hypothetical protein